MSIVTLVLGQSGTGKTASLRNLDPAHTILIQAVKKPLSFKAPGWKRHQGKDNPGNIVTSDDAHAILPIARATRRKIIILDDFQYILSNEYMRRTSETGYQKFTDIAHTAWHLFSELAKLPDDVRVYILAHTDTDDSGRVKMKTIGKMLDEKITLEGLVTICLRTVVAGGAYQFSVANNGSDTVKAPMGMFDADFVDNDLMQVDAAICDYFEISPAAPAAQS